MTCARPDHPVRGDVTLMWLLQWPGAAAGMGPQDPAHAQVRSRLLPPCCGTVDCMSGAGRWAECGPRPCPPGSRQLHCGRAYHSCRIRSHPSQRVRSGVVPVSGSRLLGN